MSCESVTADFSARVDTRQSVLNGGREYQPEPLSFHHFPTVFFITLKPPCSSDRAPALRTLNAVARTVAFLNTNVQEADAAVSAHPPFLLSKRGGSPIPSFPPPVIGFGVGGSTLTSHFDGAMVRSRGDLPDSVRGSGSGVIRYSRHGQRWHRTNLPRKCSASTIVDRNGRAFTCRPRNISPR